MSYTMKQALISLVLLCLLIAVVLLAFKVSRYINYEFGYEQKVRKTVCEMVRPEYLAQGACESN